MNKQEVIEKLEQESFPAIKVSNTGTTSYKGLSLDKAIDLVEQLDEPQKVTVPAFVAEWIELCKEKADLSSCLNGYYEIGDGTIVRPRGFSEEFYDWLSDYDHMHDLARAYLDGYEVEEEPKYRVKVGNGYFINYQGRGCLISPHKKDGIMNFDSIKEANRTADIVGGTVEKV